MIKLHPRLPRSYKASAALPKTVSRLHAMMVVAALLAATAGTASAQMRPAADLAILSLSGGGSIYPEGWTFGTFGPAVHGQFVRLGFGAEAANGYGFTAGTALAQSAMLLDASFFPIVVRVFKDFDPDRSWRRRTAYAMTTVSWAGYSNDFDYLPPYLELGCGVAWTFGIVSPKAELRVRPWMTDWPPVSLLVGFDLGGLYVFGHRK